MIMINPDVDGIRMRVAKIIVVLPILASLASLASSSAAESNEMKKAAPAMQVRVDRVIKAPVSQTMPVLGRFVARQFGVVAALTRGPVGEVLAEVGDRVARGQVIARLTPARIQATRDLMAAELAEKEAALLAAQAQLRLARGEYRRLEKLRKSAAFSKARLNDKHNEVEKYSGELAEAEAAVNRARANLRLADIDLRNAEIRAPYNAVVAQRHVVAGNYVNVGDKIVTLINDQVLEIEAEVPADRLHGVKAGRVVRVRLDDGSVHDAVIRAVIPTESPRTRTRPVRFVPRINGTAPKTGLAENQSVTVEVPIAEQNDVTTVHKDAIVARSGRNFVFVIRDGKAEKRFVRLGRAAGERFEVLDGLRPGELVAVKGNERLRPGQAVTHAPSGRAPATKNSATVGKEGG